MRKTQVVVITDDNRDKGKTFVIHEMSALHVEKWAARFVLGLTRAGVEVPEDIATAGMAGVASLGLKMLGMMSFADAEKLMDDMFACIKYRPDPIHPEVERALVETGGDADDIEEVMTRIKLRAEVFALHAGFFIEGVRLKFGSDSTTVPAEVSSTT
jgi:hypothetical protein